MASGDRHPAWFPEIIEALRADWPPEMSWAEFVTVRDLEEMLREIRNSRNVQPVKTLTLRPCCNEPLVQGAGGVSVRATILALNRFDIASANEVKFLEKTWVKHRLETGIGLNGKPPHSSATRSTAGGGG